MDSGSLGRQHQARGRTRASRRLDGLRDGRGWFMAPCADARGAGRHCRKGHLTMPPLWWLGGAVEDELPLVGLVRLADGVAHLALHPVEVGAHAVQLVL